MTRQKIEEVKSALYDLLTIVEEEYQSDPEPCDLESWAKAIRDGNKAVEILDNVLKAAKKKGKKDGGKHSEAD